MFQTPIWNQSQTANTDAVKALGSSPAARAAQPNDWEEPVFVGFFFSSLKRRNRSAAGVRFHLTSHESREGAVVSGEVPSLL